MATARKGPEASISYLLMNPLPAILRPARGRVNAEGLLREVQAEEEGVEARVSGERT
jgi:hypothetical protein